jgi:DNA-binding SARP family transcriptional activator
VFEFRVLGSFEAVAGGTRLALGGPSQRALLARLVLEANDVVSTSALVQMLWGDEVPGSAVGIVRTYVWRLRQALSAVDEVTLAGRPPGYVLEVDSDRIDARRFHRLASDARRRLDTGQPDDALALFDQALDLWSGNALADLDGFESLRPAVVRLEQQRLTALDDRVDARLAVGHHRALIGDLTALTEQHPYRERTWCQLMVALYRTGRQTDALAAYQTVRKILVDEVGVEPGPELRKLEREVLDQSVVWGSESSRDVVNSVQATGRPSAPAFARVPGVGRFVGRAHERARMARATHEARNGRLSAVFIGGPPGIGKTALAMQTASNAQASGMAVFIGRADEHAGAPMRPLNEAIAQWVAHTHAGDLDKLGATAVDELSRIVPGLVDHQEHASTDLRFGDANDRRPLFEAVSRWAGVISSDRPTVVVLEDLQWADPAALLALGHLLRRPPDASLLVLATHRDTGVEPAGALADLLAATRGQPQVHHLHLDGLDERDIVDLLRSEGGGELDEAGRGLAAQLGRTTGGNPLFVVETLRHLTERGTIAPGRGQWANPPLDEFGVPAAVTEVIAQRLGHLTPDATSVLDAAAVLGEHFDLAAAGRMVSISPIAALEALEPAIDARLIAGQGLFGSDFAFTHALVRQVILDGLSASQRTRLHWQAGEALAAIHAADPGPRRAQIAYHLAAGVHAGDPHAAIEANVYAGYQALHALAFEDARDRYSTAIKLIESTGADDDLLAYHAWMGIGCTSRGELEHQAFAFLRAATIAWEQEWKDLMTDAVLGVVAHGVNAPKRLEAPSATVLINETLTYLRDMPPTADYCVLLASMAARSVLAQQDGAAQELAEEAVKAACAVDDPESHAAAAMARSWALLGTPAPEELAAAVPTAMGPIDDVGHRVLVRTFMFPVIPVPSLQVADRPLFRTIRDQLAAQPETNGSMYAAMNLALWDGALALCDGDFDEVLRLHETVPDAAGEPHWQACTKLQATVAHIDRGVQVDIRPHLARYVSLVPEAVNGRAAIALLHAQAGEHASAVDEIERLRHERPFDRLGWGAPMALRWLAETVARLDAADLAADLLPVLAHYRGQLLVSFSGITIDAAADRAIGQLLLALGRLDEAIDRFAAAKALERSFGAHALTTRTAYWQALALLRRGRPDDRKAADRTAHRALTEAQRLGMAGLERELTDLAHQC